MGLITLLSIIQACQKQPFRGNLPHGKKSGLDRETQPWSAIQC